MRSLLLLLMTLSGSACSSAQSTQQGLADQLVGKSLARRMRIFVFLILFAVATGACTGQQSKSELSAALLHKTFFLRGLWWDDDLRFDAAGHLPRPSATATPLTSGVTITNVAVKKHRLDLSADRFSVRFQDGKPISEGLQKPLQLAIAAPPTGDYSAVLAEIFAPTLADLASSVPDYWVPCLRGELPSPVDDADRKNAGGRTVQPPVPLYAPPHPTFRASVHVVIGITVDACGNATRTVVLETSDPKADPTFLAFYRQFRYKPAMQNGRPIGYVTQAEDTVTFHSDPSQ